jgi:hypothetical protein
MIQATAAEISGMTLDNPGACLACGERAYGVEPDARRYKCESCGAFEVYGLEELLIMGNIELVDGEDE